MINKNPPESSKNSIPLRNFRKKNLLKLPLVKSLKTKLQMHLKTLKTLVLVKVLKRKLKALILIKALKGKMQMQNENSENFGPRKSY